MSDANDVTSDNLVRIGVLADCLGMPVWTLRRLADAGKIPSVRTSGRHRLFDPTAVRAALGTSDAGFTFGFAPVEPQAKPTWTTRRPIARLEEHLVWQEVMRSLEIDEAPPAGTILRYAFTEMLNNAIDHSSGSVVEVAVWVRHDSLSFRVKDDGEGAFAHLRKGLGLADDFDAISALTKGRQTTWPERHTGEGIFFTSKMLDVFQISSAGKRWTVDNIRNDHAVGISPVVEGTVVFGHVDPFTTRSSRDVFEHYSKDFEFVRTRPVVKLFGLGLRFVSRSEARRLLDGLDDFTEIDIDFEGVEDVGQGFVDELFRVWPHAHPAKTITPINMNAAVEFMVRRGLHP